MIQWGDPFHYPWSEKKKLWGKDKKTILAKLKKKIKADAYREMLDS